MLRLIDIKHLHIELTTKCNARCPMCMRNYRGYDYNSGYPLCELSLQQFQHIVSPTVLAGLIAPEPMQDSFQPTFHGTRGVSFNGNLGDFAAAKDAVEIVKYIVEHGVPVHINTNGSLRTASWWASLALPGVSIGFALDGLADTHSLYRQDTDWHRVIEHARAFIDAGGTAVWRFIPFDHNQHQEQACKDLARSMGFRRFENIYDGRDNGPVFDRFGQFSHHIGKALPDRDPPPLQHLLQNHITWYDAKTVKHSKDTEHIHIKCLHKTNRELYIAADGSVYPCCFLGFYPATMSHPGNHELRQLVHENNALEYSLEHCLQWFDRVEQTWQRPSVAQGRMYQCVTTCARKSQ